jgi:hypothetical protein
MATTETLSAQYLAGLFDGEGCIDVQRVYPRDGKGRLYVRPRVRMCLSDSAFALIQELHRIFGGNLCRRKATKPKQQNSSSLEWLSEREICSILSLILPHLFVKAEQAKLVLWWLDHAKGRQTTAGYPGMERARAAFLEELQAMKRDLHRSSELAIERIASMMRQRDGRSDVHASLVVKVCKKTGYAYPSLRVLAAPSYLVDLQSSFGGQLKAMDTNPMWVVSLSDPQSIEQVLKHCEKHLGPKWGVAMFLSMCAKAGNLHDGKVIHEAIKALNAQPYDVLKSDLEVQTWLDKVRFDLPERPRGRPRGIVETRPRRRPGHSAAIENASELGPK